MTHLRHEAEKLDDWVRFEAEFKGRYAHQLTEQIQMCETDEQLKNIIVGSLISRYGIYYKKESKKNKMNRPNKETQKMIDLMSNSSFSFESSTSRNNMLSQTLHHLQKNSGLFPLLWKADEIWGAGTYIEVLTWLGDQYYSNFEPNDDHMHWLKKHGALYRLEGKPWEG